MASLETSPAHDLSAEDVINESVDGNSSSTKMFEEMNRRKEALEEAEAAKVDAYIQKVRPAVAGALVKDLEHGIGGLYDGSNVTIAQDMLMIHSSIQQTVDQLDETRRHEDYHKEHDHTAPMIPATEAPADYVVTIGGRQFDETALKEGLTVSKTGDQFVSPEYVQYQHDLHAAMQAAGISIHDVEQAVDRKDLRDIDDAYNPASPLSLARGS